MNARLTSAVRRLDRDRSFRRAFRGDPVAATRPYRLSADELDALRAGDAARLQELGVDVARVRRRVTGRGMLALALTVAPSAAALVLALAASTGAQAQVCGATGKRTGLLRAYRRSGFRRAFRTGLRRAVRQGGIRRLEPSLRNAIRRGDRNSFRKIAQSCPPPPEGGNALRPIDLLGT